MAERNIPDFYNGPVNPNPTGDEAAITIFGYIPSRALGALGGELVSSSFYLVRLSDATRKSARRQSFDGGRGACGSGSSVSRGRITDLDALLFCFAAIVFILCFTTHLVYLIRNKGTRAFQSLMVLSCVSFPFLVPDLIGRKLTFFMSVAGYGGRWVRFGVLDEPLTPLRRLTTFPFAVQQILHSHPRTLQAFHRDLLRYSS